MLFYAELPSHCRASEAHNCRPSPNTILNAEGDKIAAYPTPSRGLGNRIKFGNARSRRNFIKKEQVGGDALGVPCTNFVSISDGRTRRGRDLENDFHFGLDGIDEGILRGENVSLSFTGAVDSRPRRSDDSWRIKRIAVGIFAFSALVRTAFFSAPPRLSIDSKSPFIDLTPN